MIDTATNTVTVTVRIARNAPKPRTTRMTVVGPCPQAPENE
ncbi:hypothetical protein [Streptomyces erythrochromogenes]